MHDTLKPRRGTSHHLTFRVMQRKLCFANDKYDLDMQKVRFELILQLKALAEQAQQKAIDTHPAKIEAKQNWSRLAAYISQVINGIGKNYEETQTDTDLQTLENFIKQLDQNKPTTQQK